MANTGSRRINAQLTSELAAFLEAMRPRRGLMRIEQTPRTSSGRRLLHSPWHQRSVVQVAVGVGPRPEPPAPRPLQEQQAMPLRRHTPRAALQSPDKAPTGGFTAPGLNRAGSQHSLLTVIGAIVMCGAIQAIKQPSPTASQAQ